MAEPQPRNNAAASYYTVQRDWTLEGTTWKSSRPSDGNNGSGQGGASMMQRWLEEPMRKEPYNRIGAVGGAKNTVNSGATEGDQVAGSRKGTAGS